MHKTVKVLLLIGGINWGLVGVGMFMGSSDFNIVHLLVGSAPILEAAVYIAVGIAAVMKIVGCKCKKCTDSCCSGSADGKTSGSM